MRGEILVYNQLDPKNLKFGCEIESKCRKLEIWWRNWIKMQKSTPPKFEIWFFENFGFEKN